MSKVRYERWECEKCGSRVNVKASNPYIPVCDDCDQERFLISVEREVKPKKRFTSSSLKALYEGNEENTARHYFEPDTMRLSGDTMRNYGVRQVFVVKRYGSNQLPYAAWDLYRIKPVTSGVIRSEYFSLEGRLLLDVRLHDPTPEDNL